MKTLVTYFAGIIMLGLSAAPVHAARYLKTEITINASPEEVWQVLMDFDRYQEWSSFIQNISGET